MLEYVLEVTFTNARIKKVCTQASIARKKHGHRIAQALQQRISEIESAKSVEEMIQWKIGRCHKLSHNRKESYAVDLDKLVRLVFRVIENGVQIAEIIEIVDYH